MLETIREYGVECLEVGEEAEEIRGRHAGFYLALAEAAEPELTGAAQAKWLARLDADYGNLRAALEWCAEAGVRGQGSGVRENQRRGPSVPELAPDPRPLTPPEIGLRLAGALGRFWQIRGSFGEGRELLVRALSLSEAAGRPQRGGDRDTGTMPADAGDRELARPCAKARSWAGFLAVYQGEYAAAESLCEASLSLWRKVGDTKGIAGTLGCMAIIAKDHGDRTTAATLFQESLALWREGGDRTGIAGTLGYLGILAADEGNAAAARSFYTESLALRREGRDQWGIAASLNNLGLLALHQGDLATARSLLEESLQVRRALGDRRCMVISLNNLGLTACGQGHAETARVFLEESLTLAREIGDRRSIAYSLEAFARLSILKGDAALTAASGPLSAARAAVLSGAAAALREAMGAPLPPADRAQFEPIVTAARAALGEERFVAAWAKGRSLALEEAIGCALESGEEEGLMG
jgi:tetratricopeptide (TPR) repeat protein